MDERERAHQVGSDIEVFSLEQLQDAVKKLSENPIYADDLVNAINSADQKEIGASLFMWLCRYLELEIIRTDPDRWKKPVELPTKG